MNNKNVSNMLKNMAALFVAEFFRCVEQIRNLKATQVDQSKDDDSKYDVINNTLKSELNEKQKEDRMFIMNFCNETYKYLMSKRQMLANYKRECEKLAEQLSNQEEEIDYDKYLRIEAHVRVALASVSLSLPEHIFNEYREDVKK